jgi:hypothetical protein
MRVVRPAILRTDTHFIADLARDSLVLRGN